MLEVLQKNKLVKVVFVPVLFFIALVVFSINYGHYKKSYRWDAAGYYAYLPAIAIFKDLSFDFHKKVTGFPKEEFARGETTKKINKYGIGSAMLQAPFFAAGHIFAKIRNSEQNGFSKPYKLMIAIGAIFYASLGLLFLGLVLKENFSQFTVNLTLLSVGLGTNLFYYTTGELMMSHVYSFFLFSFLMWLGLKWKRDFESKYFFLLCFVGGLIGAARLTNIIFLIFPLLWGIKDLKGIKELFVQIFSNYKFTILSFFLFAIPLIPQFLYLYTQTGSIINPYGKEPFFWNDPLIFKVLFSYRKGWFVWSPILFFALAGWFFGKKHPARLGFLLFMLVNLYIISSWWCWWYGGGFGMRALVESIAPMSIGLALFIEKFRKKKAVLIIFICFGIALNLFQSYQYREGVIHYDAMTKESYWIVFGKKAPLSKEIEAEKKKNLNITNAKKTMTDAKYRREL